MSNDLSNEEYQKITEILLHISQNIDIGFCSIDIVKVQNKYLVMEINSGVMMKNYINQSKNGYEIAYSIYKKAIEKMFK